MEVVIVLVLRSIIDTLGDGGDGVCGDNPAQVLMVTGSREKGAVAPGRKSAT